MIKFMGYYILILIPWMNLLRFFSCQIDGLVQEKLNSSALAIMLKFGFNQPYVFFLCAQLVVNSRMKRVNDF